jgi:nucleolar protein 14
MFLITCRYYGDNHKSHNKEKTKEEEFKELKRKHKQEVRGAAKELRKDSMFLASVKNQKQKEEDQEREKQKRKIMSMLEQEQHEMKKQKNEKQRLKKQSAFK